MTPLSMLLAGRFGLIDLPEQRKIHQSPVPRGAGFVLWTGFLFWALVFSPEDIQIRYVATGGTLVFFAGYLDDMLSLSPLTRLVVEFIAALLPLMALWPVSPVTALIYLFWIAGGPNAYNFIDGMNGLSLSMAIISMVTLSLWDWQWWSLPVAAMALGILPWNFPDAKTFMGDGGVYLLGYLFATQTVVITAPFRFPNLQLLLLLLLVGGVPVIDTLVSIIRRLLRGKSPFHPDRGHVHHRLLDAGFSAPMTLLILCAAQILCMVAASVLFHILTIYP